jgi:RES domain
LKRYKQRRTRRRHKNSPSAALLDAFTADDLHRWHAGSKNLQTYHDRIYFDLERQRVAHYEELCASLRSVPAIEIDLHEWMRVTDWRWSLTPLSPVGSVKGIGGRFNIGVDLDRARGQSFPCLYVAEDVETAFLEYFGAPLATRSDRLTLGELALRRETSFTTFLLRGKLEQVFDLRERQGLIQ